MKSARSVKQPVSAPSVARSLAEMIRSDACQNEGGYKALSERIWDANGGKPRFAVDRRKLSDLADERDVSVNLFELEALEVYLMRRGKTLKTVFSHESVLNEVAQIGGAACLFGARRYPGGESISRWDFLAATDLLKRLKAVSSHTEIELQEVLHQMPLDPSHRGPTAAFSAEPWFHLLRRDGPHGVIAIGSPMSCHATEVMLAVMFGVEPFTPVTDRSRRPPFAFLWEPSAFELLPSAFAKPCAPAVRGRRDVTGRPISSFGIEFNGIEYVIPDRPLEWTSHGIIAVQRRSSGQLWIVVAGVSGPETLAAAQALDNFEAKFSERSSGRDSATLWSVVETDIRIQINRTGDKREILDRRYLFEPRFYPPI